ELLVNNLGRSSDELHRLEPGGHQSRHTRDECEPLAATLLALIPDGIVDGDRRMPREELQRCEIPFVKFPWRPRADAEYADESPVALDRDADDGVVRKLGQGDFGEIAVAIEDQGLAVRQHRAGEAD